MWGSLAVSDVGVPQGSASSPLAVPATLARLFPGVPLCTALPWGLPGPSRHSGWHPGGHQGWGRAHGPGFRTSLTCLFLYAPQPETEDEKKRFEEGKGRYLQMKAKRQGQAEPQP